MRHELRSSILVADREALSSKFVEWLLRACARSRVASFEW